MCFRLRVWLYLLFVLIALCCFWLLFCILEVVWVGLVVCFVVDKLIMF